MSLFRKTLVLLTVSTLLGTSSLIAQQQRYGDLLSIVKFYIERDYVEKELDRKELEYGAIKGYLKSLDDPYTRFMPPKNFNEMKIRMDGEFYGIGIHIGIRDDILTVISPIIGTPADEAGLMSLDKIVQIDGDSTEGMGLSEAVNKIRGPKGSTVTLSIRREGEKDLIPVPIIRDKIQLRAVDKVETFSDGKIGYLRLTTFESQNATQEIIEGIRELQEKDVTALILDLRFNGGGLLKNAIDIASLFLEQGEVVHTVDRNGDKETEYVSGRPLLSSEPLYILVNQGSASASEILAGAIKDNDRGTIVGMNTFGKASVQKILNLPDGSAVLYTIAKYFTPKMTDITKKGIEVDIEVKVPTENIKEQQSPNYKYTYDKDIQLQRAIELATQDI